MKKIIYLLSGLGFVLASCEKNNDNIKNELEKALPAVEVTSMGLHLQTGPFLQSDVIQVTFGGAITKAEPGTMDFAWYTATGTIALVDSVHFPTWTEKAATANGNNAVTTTLLESTYPNTKVFTGNLVLKLAKLPAGNKSYTLRVYVRTKDDKMATVSQSRFVTIK